MVECADCVGGGAAGDSVVTVPILNNLSDGFAILPVVDPEAAALCHEAGEGSTVTVTLGHKIDPQWGSPQTLTGVVNSLSDGRFKYTGGIWAGEWATMGPTAVLECGSAQILITTYGTYEWRDEQFRALDMDIEGAKFIVAKNPMNYSQTYSEISKGEFVLDTLGATPPSLPPLHVSQCAASLFPTRYRDSELCPHGPARQPVKGKPAQMPGIYVNDIHSQLNPTNVDRIVPVDSLEAIQAAIAAAQDEGKSISIAGGRHAMGGQQFGSGTILLDTVPLDHVLDFDAAAGLITVEAGIYWPELVAACRQAAIDEEPQWSIAQKQTGGDRMSIAAAR